MNPIQYPEPQQTFRHQFKDGNVCEMTVTPSGGIIDAQWKRRPSMTRRFLREYLAWQKVVLQQVSNRSGKKIAQYVQVSRKKWTMLAVEPEQSGE